MNPMNICESKADCTYEAHIERRYGMLQEDYNAMLQQQHGACACCGSTSPRSKNGRLVVDHCHASGKVRGLLCHPCNVAIGKLGDDVPSVMRALHYLLRSSGCASLSEWMDGRGTVVKVHVVKYRGVKHLRMRYVHPVTGRQVVRTARTNDRAEAKRRAAKWQEEQNAILQGTLLGDTPSI